MKTDEYKSVLTELVMQIDQEKMSTLDFGRLRDSLREAMELTDENERLNAEVTKLRQDYMARISGMEKAIAVAGRGEGRLGGALETIEAARDLPAEKLIALYCRTQARFRDAFPASFNALQGLAGRGRKNKINEYK